VHDTAPPEADENVASQQALDEPPPDPGAAGIDPQKLRDYQRLRDLQKSSEAEAEAYKSAANAIEAELIEQFGEAGMQNINIDGRTIYLHRSTFAQRAAGVDAEDVKAALRAAGATDLITETVNHQTLSAYVRELLDDDGPGLPPALDGVLELGERYSIRVRAAATGGGKRKPTTPKENT
jgi:hypothetical protein